MDIRTAFRNHLNSGGGTRLKTVIGLLLLVWLSFVTLRSAYVSLGPAGLDPGWKWAVNQAHESGLVFGRDIVFTYGPLAYLMWPLDISSNLLLANLFRILVQLVFVYALMAIFLDACDLAPAISFAVVFLLAHQQGLEFEVFLLIVLCLLVLISAAFAWWQPLAIGSGLAAIMLLVKMSLGVAAACILAAGSLVAIFVFHQPRRFLLATVAYPTVLMIFGAVYFDSVGSFGQWLARSAEVVSGYSVANSTIGDPLKVWVGVLLVTSWFVSGFLFRRQRMLVSWYLILSPIIFIQFRLAYVRQDSHQLQFIPFVLAAIGCSLLLSCRQRHLIAGVIFALSVLGIGMASGLVDPTTRGFFPDNLVAGGSGREALDKLAHFTEVRSRLAIQTQQNLAPLRLPDAWLKKISGSRNGVGTLPWEIQYCPANRLIWNPTPTIQLYSAYTRSLDRWSARHYSEDSAPQFIIDDFKHVGQRHPFLDTPATWRAIFVHYRAREDWIEANLGGVLLERRAATPHFLYREIARENIVLEGAAIDVPRSGNLVFAELNLRLNSLGHLQKNIFRVPPFYIVMHHASGHTTTRRLIPGTAANGILINRFPRDATGAARLWQRIPDDPVIALHISGPGTPFFRNEVPIVWRELEFQD